MIDFSSLAGPGLRKYLANTSWMMSAQVLRIVGAFVVSILVTRYLGPENFGMLTYAATLTAVVMIAGGFGSTELLSRELVRSPESRDELLGTAFAVRLGCLLAGALAVFVYQHLFEPDPLITELILILIIYRLAKCLVVIEPYFQSIVKLRYRATIILVTLPVVLGMRLLLIELEADVTWFAWVHFLEAATFSLGLAVVYRYTGHRISRWTVSLARTRQFFREGWPFVLSSAALLIYTRIDSIMLREMLDLTQVGYYAVAVNLGQAWLFLPGIVTHSLFPAVVNAQGRDPALYRERLGDLYQFVGWSGCVIALVLCFAAVPVIGILYGDTFAPSAPALAILCWATVFSALAMVMRDHLLAENLQRYLTLSAVIGVVANVVLNLLLIPRMGIEGAALATLLTSICTSFLFLVVAGKTRGVALHMLRSVFRISLPRLRGQ